jgi:hypothetical protein
MDGAKHSAGYVYRLRFLRCAVAADAAGRSKAAAASGAGGGGRGKQVGGLHV